MNLQRSLKGSVILNEPLKNHTTLKIGGPARIWFEPEKIDDLKKALTLFKKRHLPIHIIGEGSNLLVDDKGIGGCVIKLNSKAFKGISFKKGYIDVGAGVKIVELLSFCRRNGLSGCEFLAGIPGTIGGSLIMNAGISLDKSISNIVEDVKVMEYNTRVLTLNKDSILFRYRYSNLAKYIILGARLTVDVDKKDLVAMRILNYLKLRKLSQDMRSHSAGCVFKNPKGKSAGMLIDQCNLKGSKINGAMVSKIHANYIVNYKNASSNDFLALMGKVQRAIKKRFNINLEPEIRIWKN